MAQTVRTGLFQWGKYSAAGGAIDVSLGVIDGGNITVDPGTKHIIGSGGQEIRKGGLITPSGSITTYVTATNLDLFTTYGMRDDYPAGDLAYLDIEAGADEWRIKYEDCLISDWAIDYAQGDLLKGTVNWMSTIMSEATTLQTSYPEETADAYADYECVISINTVEYLVQSFGIKCNNNVKPHTSGNTKASGSKRFPRRLIWGGEQLTIGITTAIPIPASVTGTYADCLKSDIAAVMTCTSACDASTITFTFSNLQQVDPTTMSFVDHATAIEWGTGFDGSVFQGSLVITNS